MSETKTCSKCKETKSLDEFTKDKNRTDGLDPWCRQCKARYKAAKRETIAEYNARYKADYYPKNRDRVLRKAKERYESQKLPDGTFLIYGAVDPQGRWRVGRTTNSLDLRKRNYLTDARRGVCGEMYDAIREHGIDHFHFVELFYTTNPNLERLMQIELEAITNGYNTKLEPSVEGFPTCDDEGNWERDPRDQPDYYRGELSA